MPLNELQWTRFWRQCYVLINLYYPTELRHITWGMNGACSVNCMRVASRWGTVRMVQLTVVMGILLFPGRWSHHMTQEMRGLNQNATKPLETL
jgi:hypothetical protein